MEDHFILSHIGMRDVLRGYTLFINEKMIEFKRIYKNESVSSTQFDEWIITFMNNLKASSIKEVEEKLSS